MSFYIQLILYIHIAAGFAALICGFISMLNRKGAPAHLLTGKIFFVSMSIVFVSAIFISIFKKLPFLFMVGFFSYYLACSGYRILHVSRKQMKMKPAFTDWLVGLTGIFAGLALIAFSLHWFQSRGAWGFVPLSFGIFCALSGATDIRNFYSPPENPDYLIRLHGTRMGAAFATTLTAFIVVNISLGAWSWILWLLPGVLTAIWIRKTVSSALNSQPVKQEAPPA